MANNRLVREPDKTLLNCKIGYKRHLLQESTKQCLCESQTNKKQISLARNCKLGLKFKALIKKVWVSGVVILNKGETMGATHIETKYRVLVIVVPSLCMIDYRDKYHVLLWKVSMNL